MERHVTGQELCMGLKNYALEQYGMLAPVVLRKWNINRTDDFGRIVFAMIEAELMSSSNDDTPEDFHAVFDFHQVFSQPRCSRASAVKRPPMTVPSIDGSQRPALAGRLCLASQARRWE